MRRSVQVNELDLKQSPKYAVSNPAHRLTICGRSSHIRRYVTPVLRLSGSHTWPVGRGRRVVPAVPDTSINKLVVHIRRPHDNFGLLNGYAAKFVPWNLLRDDTSKGMGSPADSRQMMMRRLKTALSQAWSRWRGKSPDGINLLILTTSLPNFPVKRIGAMPRATSLKYTSCAPRASCVPSEI